MPQLPPEILNAIFIAVREDQGLSTLTKISQVCRLWWEVVEPVLLAHVVLDNDTLAKFTEHRTNASDQLKIVRSVTLHIQVIAYVGIVQTAWLSQIAHSESKHRTIQQSDLT
jgi:hypothetical protein